MSTHKNPNIVRLPGEANIGPVRSHPPKDFADLAPTMTRTELVEHYNRNAKVIARWIQEAGTESRPVTRAQCTETARRKALLRRHRNNAYMSTPVDRPSKDMSEAGRAADYLRRFGPVIRCNRDGRYDPDGDRWLRGSTLLTAGEVVDRAAAVRRREDARISGGRVMA